MFEKKEIIESQIRFRRDRIKRSNRKYTTRESVISLATPAPTRSYRRSHRQTLSHIRGISVESIPVDNQVKRADFLHRFIAHNLKVVWNMPVRNMIFQLIDLEQQAAGKRFYMTQSAVRLLRDLLDELKTKTSVASSTQTSSSSLDEQKAGDGQNLSHLLAQQLLEKLVEEHGQQDDVVVMDDGNAKEKHDTSKRAQDPTNPTYVSPEYSIYNDFMVQLFYPQFSFEANTGILDTSCVLVSAETAQLKSSSIMDETVAGVGEGALVKNRRASRIDNAQFFVVFKKDVFKKLSERGAIKSAEEVPWPVWVPIECLIEASAPTEEFNRVVKRAVVFIQYDTCSPIYLQSHPKNSDGLFATKPDGSTESVYELEHVNSLFLDFPKIVITANSEQYAAIFDVINHLLVYSDPRRKRRVEDLETMTFALRKQNLERVVDMIVQMQQRIRYMDTISKANIRLMTRMKHHPHSPAYQMDIDLAQLNLKHRLEHTEHELLLVMEALKRVAYRRQSRNSVKKNFRAVVNSQELLWQLRLADNQQLCDLSLHGLSYYTLTHEDQSRLNTLEVDKVLMENQLPRPFYRDVIGPFLPDGRDVNFALHKMLRVYWRELAPVAGIAIIDHFEVNIHPLLFQLTYDLAKNLVEYIYPKKRRTPKEAQPTTQMTISSSNLNMSEISDQQSSRNYLSSEQLTVRSFDVLAMRRSKSNNTLATMFSTQDTGSLWI